MLLAGAAQKSGDGTLKEVLPAFQELTPEMRRSRLRAVEVLVLSELA